MSNTSKITPYDNRGSGNQTRSSGRTTGKSNGSSMAGSGATVCAGAVVGAAGLALAGTALGVYGMYRMGRWLVTGRQPSPEELKEMRAVEREYQEELSKLDRPELPDLSKVTTLDLHQNDIEMLVNTAKQMNYKVVKPLENTPKDVHAPILLQGKAGKRLAITRNETGKLSIHTTGDQGILHDLVRCQVQNKVQDFLSAKGMKFACARLSNGEMQILAQGPIAAQPGAAVEIKAHVNSDGTAHVDIDKCRGPRCQEIVDQLAKAAGCKVASTTKKEAWFQLPGEPTKIEVKT